MRRKRARKRTLLSSILLLFLAVCFACSDDGSAYAALPKETAALVAASASDAITTAVPSVVWSETLPAAPTATIDENAPADIQATPAPEIYSQTTGRLLSDGLRKPPVLAVIGNAPQVRPQTGLMQADILYEFVLDRGDTTTRLVALYSDEYPQLAGPIQGARIYFFDLQREYGSMMVYDGYPEESNYPKFNEANIDIPAAYCNALKYLFTRDTTVSSMQENTLFCRIDELANALYGANGPTVQPRFAFDPDIAYAGAKHFVKVGLSFSGKDTGKAEFVYDNDSNLLYRYERNSKGALVQSKALTYRDDATPKSEPVCVQNLIIQYLPYAALTDVYYSAELVGSGRCDYFVNGLYTPGYWRRETLDGVTSYYLRDGSPLTLVPGTTWIALHSDQRKIKIQYK